MSLLMPPAFTIPGTDIQADSARMACAAFWDYLHGGNAWVADPLVYRCSFTTYQANVEALIGA